MVLARGSSVEAARVLLEHGADVNAKEAWRRTDCVDLGGGAESAGDGQAAARARRRSRTRAPRRRTWERQVSGEKRRLFRPFGGLTALMYAAREGCVDCARALVEGGADIDLSGYRGITPLIMALDNFHFDLAAYLVEAGASLDVWDWWGRTPLYVAVDMNTLGRAAARTCPRRTRRRRSQVVGADARASGANPNVQLKLLPPLRERGKDRGCDSMLTTGATPLLRAAKTFDIGAMKLLIAHGARLDLPNVNGVAPIMAAAGYGSVECDIRGYGPAFRNI